MGVSRPTVTRSKQCGRKVPPTGTSARSAVLPRSRSAVPRRARLKARFDENYLTGAAPPNWPPSPIPWPVDPLSRRLVDPRIRSPVDPLIHSPDDPLTRGFMKSWTRGPVDLGAFLSAPGTPLFRRAK